MDKGRGNDEQSSRKSVADMVSVFGAGKKSVQPTVKPLVEGQTMVIGLSDNAVKDPRYTRVLEHFNTKPAQSRNTITPPSSKSQNSSPAPTVRRLGYNSATLPRPKSYHDSAQQTVIQPEKYPGGTYYRRKSVTTNRRQSSGTVSTPSSPGTSSKGRHNRLETQSTSSVDHKKPSVSVKRSRSFTSRVSVNVVPVVTKEKKRSSIVFSVNSDDEVIEESSPPTARPSPPKPLPKPVRQKKTSVPLPQRQQQDKPVAEVLPPVKEKIKQVDETMSVKERVKSVNETMSSGKERVKPVDETLPSGKERVKPGDRIPPSVKDRVQPVNETMSSVKERVKPEPLPSGKERVKPGDRTPPSVKDRVKPVNKTMSSVKERVKQVDEILSSSKERVKPVDEALSPGKKRFKPVNETQSSDKKGVETANETLSFGKERVNETLPSDKEGIRAVDETLLSSGKERVKPADDANMSVKERVKIFSTSSLPNTPDKTFKKISNAKVDQGIDEKSPKAVVKKSTSSPVLKSSGNTEIKKLRQTDPIPTIPESTHHSNRPHPDKEDSHTASNNSPSTTSTTTPSTNRTITPSANGTTPSHSKPIPFCKVESPLFIPKESSVRSRIELFNHSGRGQHSVHAVSQRQHRSSTSSSSSDDDSSTDDDEPPLSVQQIKTQDNDGDVISINDVFDDSYQLQSKDQQQILEELSASSTISDDDDEEIGAVGKDFLQTEETIGHPPTSTNPLEEDAASYSPIYSNMYKQYTLKHRTKSRSLSSGSNTSVSTTGPIEGTNTTNSLEIIPEVESVVHSAKSSAKSSYIKLPDLGGMASSSDIDSERELERKMSSVSLSFYQEVLETIQEKIGPPTNEDEAESINKVVDEIIRNTKPPQDDSENIYETVAEYSRKVSDYVIKWRERERKSRVLDDEELPPELPPRPSFLLQEHEISILSDNDSIPAVGELLNDPEVSIDPTMLYSPKKRKSIMQRLSPKKATPERAINESSEARNRVGSRSVDKGRHGSGTKKKKKNRPFFKAKVEPKEYETCTVGLEVCPVSDHRNTIQPTNTSESDSEAPNETPPPFSRPMLKFTTPTIVDLPMVTPDSGVYSESQHNTTVNNPHVGNRYIRNPLTPPLVTKLGVNTPIMMGRSTIRVSNSDPSLHTTLLRKSNMIVPESPSLSHISIESDETTPSLSSFESGRFTTEQTFPLLMKSPLMRKRVRSDASSDRSPANSLGAIQKNYLLSTALRKRRSSLPGSGNNAESDNSIIEVPLVHADVIMDRPTCEADELSFTVNDVIAVLDMTDNDWWQGMVEDRVGWFPASWVRLRINQDDNNSTNGEDSVFNKQPSTEEGTTRIRTEGDTPPATNECVVEDAEQLHKRKLSRKMTITKRSTSDFPRKLTSIEIRAKCIEEILTTEREYVQHLKDIVEGFLQPCQQHSKLFTAEIIEAVFSNIKEIYKFQQQFLEELSDHIDRTKVHDSQIGEVFVKMGDQFCIYSEYCNNHPNAVHEMKSLKEDPQYTYFFESCRLLRNLTDISLEGFLLTPVQRICRYPLQLSELVKHTPDDHPDHTHVLQAQSVMTKVAMVINERKRRMENISIVSQWQDTVDNWKGPDVLERSTMLIHSGELHKISKGHSQERHFFLFDHQMIYCKKDAIGGRLSYKGRVDLDKCTISDLSDGDLSHSGNAVKNAWKMNNADKDDKMYILYAKSLPIKHQWMEAFSKERHLVIEDEEKGFFFSAKMKRSAIAIGIVSNTPPPGANTARRKSLSKKSHVIIDTSLNGSSELVGVAQLKSNPSTKGTISSPSELRKRLVGGKKNKL